MILLYILLYLVIGIFIGLLVDKFDKSDSGLEDRRKTFIVIVIFWPLVIVLFLGFMLWELIVSLVDMLLKRNRKDGKSSHKS